MKGGSRRSAGGGRVILFWLIALGVAYFAIQGGEYSTVALVRQRVDERNAKKAIVTLQRQVDSLAKVKQLVLTDPAMQERIAREEFGMIKQKEILYRFATPAESAKAAKQP